jgi:hypothetical protein
MIEVAAAVTAKMVTAAEGTVMIEVAAVTEKTAADGNDGKGGGRRHIRGDAGS